MISKKHTTLELHAGETRSETLFFDAAGDHSCRVTLAQGAALHLTAFVFADDNKRDEQTPERASGGADGGSGTAVSSGSGNTVRLALSVDFEGPHAEFHLHGLYIATGRGHADIDIKVNHLVPDCTSRQLIKGIAAGNATGEFTGLVYVARDAQRTDAVQHNRNLQLDDTARIFTRPQLEIYADDVRCGHGATIGQLDEEAIYYMRQRGVGEREARRMQMQGFAADIIKHCSSEPLRELIAAKADELIADF